MQLEAAFATLSGVVPRELERRHRTANLTLSQYEEYAREFLKENYEAIGRTLTMQLEQDGPRDSREFLDSMARFSLKGFQPSMDSVMPRSAMLAEHNAEVMEHAKAALVARSIRPDLVVDLGSIPWRHPVSFEAATFLSSHPFLPPVASVHRFDPTQDVNDPRCAKGEPTGCRDVGCAADGGFCFRRAQRSPDFGMRIGCDCSEEPLNETTSSDDETLPPPPPPPPSPAGGVIRVVDTGGCESVNPGLWHDCVRVGCPTVCIPTTNSFVTEWENVTVYFCTCAPAPVPPSMKWYEALAWAIFWAIVVAALGYLAWLYWPQIVAFFMSGGTVEQVIQQVLAAAAAARGGG